MTKLSVNINKFATLRNARGGNNPNVVQVAKDCEKFGSQGITIHPRPDERHITQQDVYDIKNNISTELNIEGYPNERFLKILEHAKPDQATLVPDPPGVLTSNAGWDTIKYFDKLKDIVQTLKDWGIRTSIFVEPKPFIIEGAAKIETDRIELYTEQYAVSYSKNPEEAIRPYKIAAEIALKNDIELNAGHDLDLSNLKYFKQNIPKLKEVSIGHALVCDSIYYGLENTIQMYRNALDI